MERRLISERTKAALSAKKASGIRLNPHNLSLAGSRGRAIQVRAADEFAQTVLPVIRAIQAAETTSFASIADVLNEHGIKSARRGKWHVSSVAIREPPDVLLLQRTIKSLEQENAWPKEQLAHILRKN